MGSKNNIIYIAGPYRSATERGLEENIRHAEDAAVRLWQNGWAVICPHKNSAHFGGIIPDQSFLDRDLDILRRCDAIYLLDGWQFSAGAKEEARVADETRLQFFYEGDLRRPETPSYAPESPPRSLLRL